MTISQILSIANIAIGALFMLCYSYQVVYIIVSFFKKSKVYPESEVKHRFAFVVSARNEENVIGQLCDCIRLQDYPRELIDIHVVADNCTDSTAKVAEAHGAIVYERFNEKLIGKGYAMTELFAHIKSTVGYDAYDGYIVVDADNILEPDYVKEMNNCFSDGNRLIIGYRNSKNYGDNWISAGYALWFMRESRQLNSVRGNLGVSCEIKGTGFLVHKDIIKRQDGWAQHLLIEDVQFTVDNVLMGEKVAYCDKAILYDEQPKSFKVSWRQRRRWCRGYIQILKRYSGKLLKAFFTGKGFSNYDMMMAMSPAFFISLAAVIINAAAIVGILIFETAAFGDAMLSVALMMLGSYLLFAIPVALFTVISEWKRIHASTFKKIMSVITFPIFMATYIPIAAASLFGKVEWKPIKHNPVGDDSEVKMPDNKG